MNLKSKLKELRISQKMLAESLGVQQSAVSRIVNKKQTLTFTQAITLAKIMKVTLYKLRDLYNVE